MFSGSRLKLSSGGTSDFVRRQCVLEIQDGNQITGSIGLLITSLGLQIHNVVPKTIQRFITMYKTSKSPAIMADPTSYRQEAQLPLRNRA